MSNLLEQASLVMIPSGYKEDVVYSEIPLDGSGDLQLTRASNGTRVNSQGLVEVCPWNLLSNTDTFSSWALEGGTLTSGFTAPDGSSTAYKYVQPTLGSGLWATQNLPIMSAGTGATLQIYVKSVSGSNVTFNLGSGYSSTGVSTKTATSQWQLFTVSFAFADGGSMYVNAISDTTNGIYVWHPQVNVGLTAKPYFPTTDRLNVPRLTYQNGGGGCPSLLLEKQSTNIVPYSEQFDNAAWTKIRINVSANYSTSPDGTQNADLIYPNSTGEDFVYQNITGSTNQTNSIYVKAAGKNYCWLLTHAGNVGPYFNLSNGTITSDPTGTATITSVGNGWYRITVSTSTGSSYIGIGPCDVANTSTATPNGMDGILVWGAQDEASSYPTSYIPTTSSSATRVADAGTTSLSSAIVNAAEGVLFLDFQPLNVIDAYPVDFQLQYNGTSAVNGLTIYQSGNTPAITVRSGGSIIFSAALTATTAGTRNKIAIAYKANDFAVYQNGVQKATQSSGVAPAALNELRLSDGTRNFSINEALVFPTRLTNAELASLTTI